RIGPLRGGSNILNVMMRMPTLSLAFVIVALAACLSSNSPMAAAATTATVTAAVAAPPRAAPPAPPPEADLKELPPGGRALFPAYRLVGYCGTPGAPALGELQGNLKNKAKALETRAATFAGGRKVLPVFELIAVVVQGSPQADGKYRRRVP